jgi:hypothetical protein
MPMKILNRFCLAAAVATLTACSANTLRVESAGSVSAASTAMVTQARETLAFTRARRDEANTTLVASDRSCSPGAALLLLRRGPDWTPSTPRAPLCAATATPPLGYVTQRMDLSSISDETLKPTLLMIAAVADYGSALSKIVERPDADIAEELNALAGKASEASVLANALLGTSLPSATQLLATDQAQAALALLQFAERLSAEARRVRDIRAVVRNHGAEIDALIPRLRDQLTRWLRLSAEGDAQIYVGNLQRVYREQRDTMDFDGRRALVRLINDARLQVEAVQLRQRALDQALTTFQEAQTQLREHLAGNFTPQERARIAQLNRRRMIEALGLVARAISAFGVTL